jgi:hypothetical protein
MTRHRMPRLLPVVLLAACVGDNPAEVRSTPSTFPLIANWSASAAPVSPSTVRATLSIKQYLGFHMEASVQITGAASATYQWRVFRGDCATTAVAANNTAPTGLLLFETIQSYPDVTTSAAGTGTATPIVAGSLDSLTAYSVRVRVSQTQTNWNGTSPVACGNLLRSPAG